MTRSSNCEWCGTKYWTPEALMRHKQKPHYQCPICPKAMIRLVRHLEHHYWEQIRPMVQQHLDSAQRVN